MKHFTVVAVRVFELDEAGHVAAFRLLARATAYTHAGASSRAAISSHLGGTARLPPGVGNVV
ncbi:MAG: hypothetical protein C0506_09660, partial [Anaerolinea sp.]|nr:hypothetical protein [Anaerolinea sp.]